MKSYSHSETFNVLKKTKESISNNLTSAQYLHTLDYFIWNALAPIAAECPSFFSNYIAKCVAHQALHPNSKFTSDDKVKLPLTLFNMLSTQDPKEAFELARKLYLNRGLLFGLISVFLDAVAEYKELQSAFTEVQNFSVFRTKLSRIEDSVGVTDPKKLYAVIKEVEYWDTKARRWKSMIVEKFTRMAMLNAQRTYVDFNHYVELDDVSQIYLMIVSKVIDRCDARLGVLTTFMQSWFNSARAKVTKMSESQGDESLELIKEAAGDSMALGCVGPDTSSEDIQEIAFRMKQVDPIGVVRTHLGLPEYVTAAQRQILMNFSLE